MNSNSYIPISQSPFYFLKCGRNGQDAEAEVGERDFVLLNSRDLKKEYFFCIFY